MLLPTPQPDSHPAVVLSEELKDILLTKNEGLYRDRLEVVRVSPVVGRVKLKNYWDSFHVNYDRKRHKANNPVAFYEEGNTPILTISVGEAAEPSQGEGYAVFRPSDLTIEGLGGAVFLRGLPEEVAEYNGVIVTGRGRLAVGGLERTLIEDPNTNPHLQETLKTLRQ